MNPMLPSAGRVAAFQAAFQFDDFPGLFSVRPIWGKG